MPDACSVVGCERTATTKTFCTMHYKRWRRNGDAGESDLRRQPGRKCTVPGCENPYLARGYCGKHYQRQGDKTAPRAHEITTDERFWTRVDKTGAGGCWLWTGSLNTGGYGRFALTHDTTVMAHRYAYEQIVGPIPDGLELDHVWARGCFHRHCVNPAHLEPVTALENLRRSGGGGAVNGRKTHCIEGHPLHGDNLYVRPNGKRECIACRTERKRNSRASPASGS